MFTTPFAFLAQQSGGGFDPDAQAYLDAVVAAGGTVTSGQEEAINNFYLSLKEDEIYSKLYFAHLYLGGTEGSNSINAISPGTYDLVFYGTWTHSNLGSTTQPNASNYADTGFLISTESPSTIQTDWSFGTYIVNPSIGSAYQGIGEDISRFMVVGKSESSSNLYQPIFGDYTPGSGQNPSFADSTGVWMSISRSNTSSWFGTWKTASSPVSTGVYVTSVLSNAYTISVTPRTIWYARINGHDPSPLGGTHRFEWAGTFLSESQTNTLLTRVNTLQIAFSRNIFTV